MKMLGVALLVLIIQYFQGSFAVLPVKLLQLSSDQCSLDFSIMQPTMSAIDDAITNIVNPELNELGPVCDCGGPGWTQVAYINMSDPSQQCPNNWNTYNDNGIRGCNRRSQNNTCDSAIFPVNGIYTRVCGKVLAYSRGDPDAFLNSIRGINSIEQSYVDGVSVTYGAPGSRKHIWTFASADSGTGNLSSHSCSCIHSDTDWPHTNKLPSFMGNNYFCELGLAKGAPREVPYPNILWDGKNCTDPNTCCKFSNPPWFCVSLPEPTSEPIEVRLCLSEGSSNEDIFITDVEIYAH